MRIEKIKVTIPIHIIKEEESFVAYSPTLDLSTCGLTAKEAKKNFSETAKLFFEEGLKLKHKKAVLWT